MTDDCYFWENLKFYDVHYEAEGRFSNRLVRAVSKEHAIDRLLKFCNNRLIKVTWVSCDPKVLETI